MRNKIANTLLALYVLYLLTLCVVVLNNLTWMLETFGVTVFPWLVLSGIGGVFAVLLHQIYTHDLL